LKAVSYAGQFEGGAGMSELSGIESERNSSSSYISWYAEKAN